MGSDPERDELIERHVEQFYADDPEGAQRWRDSFKYWALAEDGETLISFDDVVEWAQYRASKGPDQGGSEPVKQEYVVGGDGETYFISTVLIGLDMGMGMMGGPLIFETMIFKMLKTPIWRKLFGRSYLEDRVTMDFQLRYPTIASARAGHDQAAAHVRDGNLIEEMPWG